MMPTVDQIVPQLVHIGALLYLFCFLFRDQVWLRSFAVAGDLIYAVYFLLVSAQPLWGAMFWSLMNVAINVVMIGLIIRDQRASIRGDDDLLLFRRFDGLSPGQFRRLVAAGNWMKPESATVLTRENEVVDRLYFVLDGEPYIEKSDRHITAQTGIFIGELAFLRDRPATATVTVPPGTRLISWPRERLKTLLEKDAALGQAFSALLARDMAEKVAKS